MIKVINKLFIFVFLFEVILFGQEKEKIFGVVSFISSQYVYIKLNSTDGINQNDSLYLVNSNKLAGVVQFMSSNSIAAKYLEVLKVGDSLYTYVIKVINRQENKKNEDSLINVQLIQPQKTKSEFKKFSPKTYILRMSVQSYSDLNNYDNTARYRYSFSFDKQKFLDEKMGLKSYFIINYNKRKSSTQQNDIKDLLKIYDLSFEYEINKNHSFRFGRSLNPNIFSIGSIDGAQYFFKKEENLIGAIIGSRPDYSNYWFNLKLLQFGLFYNRIDSINSKNMDNTIAFIEQTNELKSDRRYLYLQHRNNLIPLTNIFISSEIDFFDVDKGISEKKLNLVSLYSLVSFKPMRQINLNLSYDARKNVYYLESFKNTIDTLIENELRQGFRVSAFIRPINLFYINLQYGRREIKKDTKPSENYGMTIGFNNLPLIYTNINFGFNNYQTTLFKGENYTIHLTKNLFWDLMLNSNFRLYQFTQIQSGRLLIERYIEIGMFINLLRNLSFSINFEQKLNNEKSKWLMFDLTNRF